ncbi:hypothetical protein J6590_058174, partial [Homalodisca vitripennis]
MAAIVTPGFSSGGWFVLLSGFADPICETCQATGRQSLYVYCSVRQANIILY